MFFQTDPTAEAAANAANQTYIKFESIKKEIGDIFTSLKSVGGVLGSIASAFEELGLEAEELNKNFLQGRQRLDEMLTAINASAPAVIKLGGSYGDIRKTIAEIAAGTRTQTIASEEQVGQLFAASKVIGENVKDIVDKFDRVGFSYDRIAENLSESIVYVQNVGQNARAVMKDVLTNTDQLSRFNFENGVKGLTKMAAQASMMRFDMSKTFAFAENVLDPEKAVEVSSAFQRLGVSVGNLTDPFQLMNQSITDPSGLQTSLINITKQFTYFDQEAKQFKINPQGILTLREIAPVAGMTAEEMRKTALAAAEMDSKLAKINTTGFNLNVTEEDKMLVANIASMGKGGEYEVKIKDEEGNEYTKKLAELQETDFQRLIDQQKQAPKTIEEIQKQQLNTAETMLGELKGIQQTMKTAFFGLPGMVQNVSAGLNLTRDVSKILDTTLRDQGFQGTMQNYKEEIEKTKARTDLTKEQKEKKVQELYDNFKTDAKNSIVRTLSNAGTAFQGTLQQQGEQVRKLTEGAVDYFNKFLKADGELFKTIETGKKEASKAASNINYGILTNQTAAVAPTQINGLLAGGKGQLDVNFANAMTVTVNVNAPSGMDGKYLTQIINESQDSLKEAIYSAVKKVSASKGEVKV